jgi:hypothetical protein
VWGKECMIRMLFGGGDDPVKDVSNSSKVGFTRGAVKLVPDVGTVIMSWGRVEREVMEPKELGSHVAAVLLG